MLDLIDTHSHLDAPEFDADRTQALERANAAGVARQIVPAVAVSEWPKLRQVCAAATGLFPAYGLHPMLLAEHRFEHLNALEEWVERERPCAVGECGLDFFVPGLDADGQRGFFVAQLDIARAHELPVILHARRAVDEVIATVRRVGGLRGVVHSFSGSAEQARQLFKLGFHLGFGGPITYARATRLRGIVAAMPIEHLLLETDSPDQPLATHRGARNEPARLVEVAHAVAQLRGVDAAEIAQATTRNAEALFCLGTASAASL